MREQTETQAAKPAPGATEEGGAASILRHVARSKVALGLIALLLALALAELTWSGFRESFSEKYPFTVGVISSFLFIALGAIAVDLYLNERDEQRRRLELKRERDAWSPTARRIFDELDDAVRGQSGAVADAQLALSQAEAGIREADLEGIAKSIEEGSEPLRDVLLKRFPLIVLRPELVEAAGNAEEAAQATETAAGIVRRWDFDAPNSQGLLVMVEDLVKREQWFAKRRRAIFNEADRTEAEAS